ncbi:MAG: hypothetical protein WCD49_04345 [Candidatus Acidiferrales bacterium]
MKTWLTGSLAVSIALISCAAKSAPTRILINANDYSGSIFLSPCQQNAGSPVTLNATGSADTSACPSTDDVEIIVIKHTKSLYIAPEKINVARAGDGAPVSITAVIP